MTSSAPSHQENCLRCGDFFTPVAALNDANPGLCQECYGYYDQAWLARVNRGFGVWSVTLGLWIGGIGLLTDNNLIDSLWIALWRLTGWPYRVLVSVVMTGPSLIMTAFCLWQWRRAQAEHEKIDKGPMKRRWQRIIGRRLGLTWALILFVLSGWLVPWIQPYYNTQLAMSLGWIAVISLALLLARPVSFEKLTEA